MTIDRTSPRFRTLVAILVILLPVLAFGGSAYASHGEPHATIKTWDLVTDTPIEGDDPHETIHDVDGLTNHVGAPTMVTSMENTLGGFCGFLFWNPNTNAFKTYGVTGGFQFAADVNRGSPAPPGSAADTFGGGDSWATVNRNNDFSPYMNFRGSDNFRRWDVGASLATGIRVDRTTGKVYLGNSVSPGQLIELDPATNAVRTWVTGSQPYNLLLLGGFVWATAVADAGSEQPDQILRLDPATNELARWNVPGAGNFTACCPFGTPNSIARDLEGSIWFTESASDQLGRLNPTTNVIDEFSKGGLDNPHAIASSGVGDTLQSFFTEGADPGHISLITVSQATPTRTSVSPMVETITPTTSTSVPVDFVVEPVTATIVPSVFDSEGVDPSGIVRFPVPPGHSEPTGMTPVVIENTVFGSMEGSDHVFEVESAAIVAPPGEEPPAPTPPTAPPEAGYWEVGRDGAVFAFGTAGFFGSMAGRRLAAPVVGMDSTPNPHGYWLVASDGGVFTFGSAGFFGSMGGRRLNAPVVGIAAHPSGNGYWEVASDGGVFTFGSARFFGSMGGTRLNAPIVGISATPGGNGYYLYASDGGVFAFGDAVFRGSMGGTRLVAPIVGGDNAQGSYWLVASDGGVFAFGVGFFGSAAGRRLLAPVVGISGTPDDSGYWLGAAAGAVFNFGSAAWVGSKSGFQLDAAIVGIEGVGS